jgi:hypothetical protein
VLPRPPPQLPLLARYRVFPEAATGSRREQLRCSAILYLPPTPARFLHPCCGGRADGESRVERRGSRARRLRALGVGRGGGCPVTRPDIFVP